MIKDVTQSSNNYCTQSGTNLNQAENVSLKIISREETVCKKCNSKSNYNYCTKCGSTREEIIQNDNKTKVKIDKPKPNDKPKIINKTTKIPSITGSLNIKQIIKSVITISVIGILIGIILYSIGINMLLEGSGMINYLPTESFIDSGIFLWSFVSFVPIDIDIMFRDMSISILDMYKLTDISSETGIIVLTVGIFYAYTLFMVGLIISYGKKVAIANTGNGIVNIAVFSVIYSFIIALARNDIFLKAFIIVYIVSFIFANIGYRLKNR